MITDLMRKRLLITVLSVFGALIAFGGALLFLQHSLTAGFNRLAPGITGTKASLGSARISPLGSITLGDLVIGNPAGWSERPLCSAGRIHLAVAPLSVLGETVIVHELSLEAPEFNYETRIVASNVADLLKNIEASLGTAQQAPASGSPAAAAKPRKFIVGKFRLAGGKVHVGTGTAGVTLSLPAISLDNLGTREGGLTANQLAFAVTKELTGRIVEAAARGTLELGKTGGAGAAEAVKQAGEAIKGLFGGKK
jgi:uncharacterized protein involved in outer membrane biogenesis